MKLSPITRKYFFKTLWVFMVCAVTPLCITSIALFIAQAKYLGPLQKQNATILTDNIARTIDGETEELDTFVISSMVNGRIPYTLKQLLNSNSFSYTDLIIFGNLKDQLSILKNTRAYLKEILIWYENPSSSYLSESGKYTLPKDTPWLESLPNHDKDYGWWTICTEKDDSNPEALIYLCHRLGGGGIIAFSIYKNSLSYLLASKLPLSSEKFQVFSQSGEYLMGNYEETNNSQYIQSTLTTEETKWKVTVYSPKSIVYRLSFQLLRIVLIILTTALIIGLILSYEITKLKTRQISRLIDMIHDAEKGNLHPIDQYGKAEATYDYLFQKILSSFIEQKYLKSQLETRKYKLENAELIALQLQVNPHFLYNTLEALNWKCYQLTGAPNEANQIIENLSDLLRYALGKDGIFVPFSEELQYVESYLKIMEFRQGNKFIFNKEIDMETLDWPFPRMILQPLLENAIIHGCLQTGPCLIITLLAQREGDELHITISDDGAGMDATTLASTKKLLEGDEIQKNHIGLQNVNLRLKVLYGETLEISSVVGKGTKITFAVSMEAKQNVQINHS